MGWTHHRGYWNSTAVLGVYKLYFVRHSNPFVPPPTACFLLPVNTTVISSFSSLSHLVFWAANSVAASFNRFFFIYDNETCRFLVQNLLLIDFNWCGEWFLLKHDRKDAKCEGNNCWLEWTTRHKAVTHIERCVYAYRLRSRQFALLCAVLLLFYALNWFLCLLCLFPTL